HLFFDGAAVDHVDQLHLPAAVGDDRVAVRIPLVDHGTGFDRLTVRDADDGAVRDPVPRAHAALLVDDRRFALAADGDRRAAPAVDGAQVRHLHAAVAARHLLGLLGDTRRRAADVEGA